MALDLWTIVPVHGVAAGKSRLAAVLDAAARARLNRWLLEHTLGVVAAWRGGLDRCAVVSACPEAGAIAARHGAATVVQSGEAGGLNAAAALGAAFAAGQGARRALVVACDLPKLTREALAAVADAAAAPRHMVIAPDRRGTGTNALIVRLEAPFEFRFGECSCARHLGLAAERGWQAVTLMRPELAFDLDTPEDLAAWHERASLPSGSPMPQ